MCISPSRKVEDVMQRIKGLMLTMLAGTLLLAAPTFAQSRGGHAGGGHAGGFARGGGAQHFSGRSFNAPARGFSGGARNFNYRAPARGYVGGGGLRFGV